MRSIHKDLPNLAAGPYRFACNPHWAKLPPGLAFGITHGVALDASGRVYIAHTGSAQSQCRDTVFVFDRHGTFLDSWGSEFFNGAHGLEIVAEEGTEYAYLTDLERGLFKLTLDGATVWHFAKPKLYQKAFGLNWRPSNVAFAPGTDLYLADGYGSAFIVRIDRKTGEEIALIGGPGTGPQHLFHPHGLLVDPRSGTPELLVAENVPPRLRRFSLDGEPLPDAPKGSIALIAPRHFAWLGDTLVAPDLGGQLVFLDRDKAPEFALGAPELPFDQQVAYHDQPPQSCPPGTFRLPHDAAADTEGNLYLVEWIQGGRVSKLHRQADPN